MVETWTTAALTTMWTVEAQLERLLRGTILATGLETVCDTWQRVLQHSVQVFKTLPKAEFKSSGLFLWRRRF